MSIFAPVIAGLLASMAPAEPAKATAPRLIASSPAHGEVVPAGEVDLVWTFDRPMDPDGWSVTGHPATLPVFFGQPSYTEDGRTFRIKMRLEPGHAYDVGVNSPTYRNFRSEDGVIAAPARIRFKTEP